jgi:hypothetical protein
MPPIARTERPPPGARGHPTPVVPSGRYALPEPYDLPVRTTCERCVQDLLYCDARGCRSVGTVAPRQSRRDMLAAPEMNPRVRASGSTRGEGSIAAEG